MAHYPAWVPGLIGAVGAPLVWAALTLLISFLKAPGEIIGERDATIESANARIRELEAQCPRLSACLEQRGRTLLLVVSNDGATADVSAKITVAGDTLDPQSNATAAWRGESAGEVKIRTGDRKEIILAERRSHAPGGRMSFHWAAAYFQAGALEWTRPARDAFPTQHPGGEQFIPYVQEIRQRVSVRVLSDQPPIEASITLVGSDLWDDLVGVPWCSAQPTDSAALTRQEQEGAAVQATFEQWEGFDQEVSSLMSLFRSVREAGKPGDERVFRGVVQEVLASADELPDSYKYDALSLLQPFADGELSALDIHAATLQDWQTKMRRHFLTQRWRSQPSANPPSSTPSGSGQPPSPESS